MNAPRSRSKCSSCRQHRAAADDHDHQPPPRGQRPARDTERAQLALQRQLGERRVQRLGSRRPVGEPVDLALRVLQGGRGPGNVGGSGILMSTHASNCWAVTSERRWSSLRACHREGWRTNATRSQRRTRQAAERRLAVRAVHEEGAGCYRPHGDPGHRRTGRVLAKEGTPGQEFVVVVEGTASATSRGEEVGQIGPGSFFGELALLDGGPRTATVRALTPMLVLVLDRSEFNHLVDRAIPSVGRKMLVTIAERLRSERLRAERLRTTDTRADGTANANAVS